MKVARTTLENAVVVTTTCRLLIDLLGTHPAGLSFWLLLPCCSLLLLTLVCIVDESFFSKVAGQHYQLREEAASGHTLGAVCIPWVCAGLLLVSPQAFSGVLLFGLHSSVLSSWAMVLFLDLRFSKGGACAASTRVSSNGHCTQPKHQLHQNGTVPHQGASPHGEGAGDDGGAPHLTNGLRHGGQSMHMRNGSSTVMKLEDDTMLATGKTTSSMALAQTQLNACTGHGSRQLQMNGPGHSPGPRSNTTTAICLAVIITSFVAVGSSAVSSPHEGTFVGHIHGICVSLAFHAALCVATLHFILRNLPGSFTIGESMVLAQGVAFLVWDTLSYAVQYFMQHIMVALRSTDTSNLTASDSDCRIFVQGLVVSTVAASVVVCPLLSGLRQAGEYKQAGRGNLAALAGIAALLVVLVFRPALWVLQFALLSAPHRSVMLYWLMLLLGCLPLMLTASRTRWLPNILVRKGYHLLAFALFLPPLMAHPQLLSVALAVAFALFVALEVIRVGRVPPFGAAIHSFMTSFIDYRDSGVILVSHFTLLLGMAVPVWLASGSGLAASGQLYSVVLPLSGLMMLGVCDTAACAIGRALGRHPVYSGAKKTIEGTVGGIMCTLLTWLLLYYTYQPQLQQLVPYSTARCITLWVNLCTATVMSALLEAATTQLDNIFLPLHYFALLCTL